MNIEFKIIEVINISRFCYNLIDILNFILHKTIM